MDTASDPIKALLVTTGLSCDDLLQKLLLYKNQQGKTTENSEVTVSPNKHDKGKNDKVDGQSDVNDSDAATPAICNETGEQDSFRNDVEKTNSVLEPVDKPPENISSVVEHKEEVSGFSLKNGLTEPPSITGTPDFSEVNQEDADKQDDGVASSLFCPEQIPAHSDNSSDIVSINDVEPETNANDSHIERPALKSDENTAGIDELKKIISRRKSISEELARKLSGRINVAETEKCDDDEISQNMDNKDDTNENDIEVCQIEDSELPKPLLKLRSDLFANDSMGNFVISDGENEENSSEIKEFLRNVEEVTGEVKGSPKKNLSVYNNKEAVKFNSPKVRKVKMGFVKKRILNKAIKCLNDIGARKIEPSKRNGIYSSSPEKMNNDNECGVENLVSEEEVRKNLKLQLSTLRNRKRTTDSTKDNCNINKLKITYDKKKVLNSSSVACSTTPTKVLPQILSDEVLSKEVSSSEPTTLNSLFSLSTETNFVIVDVQGGVEFPDIEEEIPEIQPNPPSDVIKLTKTKDVTKIKGWQNKKFQLSKEINQEQEEPTKTKESIQCDLSKPSCSRDNVQNETSESKKEELSPFVSNSLEEFLTENSTLNISYNIPKLGAEEGINTEKYNKVLISQSETPPNESEKREDNDKKEKPKTVKPKTLAEKRRMLEKSKSTAVGKETTLNKEITLNKETSNKEKTSNKETLNKETSIKEKTLHKETMLNEGRAFNRESYVIYNGQKIHVPTTASQKWLGNIKFTPKLHNRFESTSRIINETNESKKLSLLHMYHQKSIPVSYRPGPLQAKHKLQNNESQSEWHPVVCRMPKVKLKIIPEVGKPIPPHLEHFFKFGPKIEEDRLELALSALVTKKPVRQGFSLTVPYANKQKYILVRKKNSLLNEVIYDVSPEKNTVKSVLDDIISYVEIKEKQESIIKDAEVYTNDTVNGKDKEMQNSVEVSPVKKPKRRKLDNELLRLSCKVLSVSVDENEEDGSSCQKSFCKLGCVCKSLSCTSRIPIHCSKIECMFECKCSTRENISFGGETLSSDAVNRLEDQAKRNLAPVEKEFTQTIIHTNDRTILIPSSDRNKAKRTKRMPKRYSDYLEDIDSWENETVKEDLENTPNEIPQCFVKLQKLNLNNIVPLCLYHNSYSCKCFSEQVETSNPSSDVEGQDSLQSKNIKRKKLVSLADNKKLSRETKEKDEAYLTEKNTESARSNVETSEDNISDSEYVQQLRIQHSRRNKVKEGCARLFGVHPEVLARNEIPFYKNKLKAKVKHAEVSNQIKSVSVEYPDYVEPFSDHIDITTPLSIPACDRLKLSLLGKLPRKRKQASDNDILMPKMKKIKKNLVEKSPSARSSDEKKLEGDKQVENQPYNAVFDGEIIVPTHENKDFVKKLGVKSAAPFMRLLPWNDLLRNYYNNNINIWCPSNSNKNMLLNLSHKGPPPGYIEITQSKRKNGIMNWILSMELPKNTPSQLVHLILSPKDDYFEISGICLKNITEVEKAKGCIKDKTKEKIQVVPEVAKDQATTSDNRQSPTSPNIKTSIRDNMKQIDESKVSNDEGTTSDDSKYFMHKDQNNKVNTLIFTQRECPKQVLYILPESLPSNEEAFPLYVGLPYFESLRWRILFLNSNFTFLKFLKSNYSIKYTDLMNIVKKAQDRLKTVCLYGKKLSGGYSQKNFGIYAVPKFIDMLFIGPYELKEEHGLQTLRYLKQELVPTEYFEKVQGGTIPNKRKDKWLISKAFYTRLASHNSPPSKKRKVITPNSLDSLSKPGYTENEYAVLTPLPGIPESSIKSDQINSKSAEDLQKLNKQFLDSAGNFITTMDLDSKSMLRFPDFMILNDKILRQQDYNCYMVTNIPNFGYLGALNYDETPMLEVEWPFGNKVLRFVNATVAAQFIKRRFSNLLLPVPAAFTIEVHIEYDMKNLDELQKVDPKFLNGTHICGTFGILDSRKLTPELAITLGTTQEEVLERLAKRAQFLGSLEIDKLKAQEKVLIEQKKELIVKKQNYLKRYMELLQDLPEEKRLREYSKLMQQLDGGGPKDTENIECIEIADSDSDSNAEPVESTTPKKKNMVTPLMLKSSVTPPIITPPSSSDNESSKSVANFKLVKNSSGKMVLVKDNSGASLSRSLTGMKLKIKNNRVICAPEISQ